MAHGQFHAELRQLRTMLAGPMTDADLMHRFVEKRDEAAFASLVRRHGSLVLRVCRNVLHQDADADDAFQATFLVLARKAASFRKGTSLACWLHGVAYRCSMNLRKSAMRRHAREKAAAGGRSPESSASGAAWNELQACLHEEVQRLPAAIRAAFVLCVLEDKGRAEAARALGCPEGTLASRLAKARKILQKRLTSRGVTLSAALCSAAIATGAASASAALVPETTTAALAFAAGNGAGAVSARVLALAEGVLKGMLLTKLKIGGTLLVAVLLGVAAAGSLVAQPSGPDIPAKRIVAPDLTPQAANETPEARSDKLAHVDSRGDALPEAALVRLGSARMRHGGMIFRSELSPDGKTLATAGEHSLIVWDLDSGKETHRFPFGRSLTFGAPGLTFSPDGSHLAYVRNGTFGGIWDVRTGKETHRIELPRKDTRKAEDHLIGECRFVNDGKDLLYLTRSALHRFNLDSKRIVESVPVKDAQVLSPDGKTFIRIEEKELIPTEVATGKILARIENSSAGPFARPSGHEVIYAPDGKSFAFVHDQREVQHRELPSGKILATFPLANAPDAAVRAQGGRALYFPQFSRDGRILAVATSRASQRFAFRWDLASGKELPALRVTGSRSTERNFCRTGARS
jgi:RNA polymerase sigma factor (sigma-70 family)